MKIAFTKKIITPEIGATLAGYGFNNVSIAKRDDLYLNALCLDDGNKKAVILSYDLLGLSEDYIKTIRREGARIIRGVESDIILNCTHTHSGPHTRKIPGADVVDIKYIEILIETSRQAMREIMELEFIDSDVFFYSLDCDENINRRYCGGDNRCSFLPHRRDMERIADGICDKELGIIFFLEKKTKNPVYVIGNYAAHPLAGHAPGLGGLRISADFPGVFRDYIESETGAGCMYITGAAGDMVPKGHELGTAAMRKVGLALGQAAIDGLIAGTRNPERFKLGSETLQSTMEKISIPTRKIKLDGLYRDFPVRDNIELEIQLLSIGELCLIGVPGELVAELGLEMKWHSPFRKTFILYCSTGYCSYICHGNALVAGGYEARRQIIVSRGSLMLLNAVIEGTYKLYERSFPDPQDHPDNKITPLVSLKNI